MVTTRSKVKKTKKKNDLVFFIKESNSTKEKK